MCTSEMGLAPDNATKRPGRIQAREVDVAGAGIP
jgi:hypothetical protein